jgi:ABC-type branched-subunit amino acid transport system substrate-binding protein
MNIRRFSSLLYAPLLWGAFAGTPAIAKDVLIGQVVGYESATGKQANETRLGASVLIDSVNARGGVNGNKLRLVTADDHYKAADTVKLVGSMVGKVSALLPIIGSDNYHELVKSGVIDKGTLPIVGVIPSNRSMRTHLHKNVFHFKAGDSEQLEKIVEQLTTVGIRNIAVVARDNPSSKEAIETIQEALKQRGAPPPSVVVYDVTAKSFAPQVKFMQEKQPDAVIMLGITQAIAKITREFKTAHVSSLLYTMGNADPELIWKVVGPEARGFVISQVFPNLNRTTLPVMKTFREDFAKYAKTTALPTYYNFEGYLAARLIVEAMRKSKDTSAEGVKRGLEQMRDFDLGGYIVDFSPTNHVGSNWVDLSIMSQAGVLVY